MSRKVTIDEVDAKILEQYQKDSTITNKELAEVIGLSPPPTLMRVRNLIKHRFIEDSVARIGWKKLGFQYQATVFMAIQKKDRNVVETLLAETDGIMGLARMHKQEQIPRKVFYYQVECVFRTERDFKEAWVPILVECDFHLDFEVLQLQERIIKNKVVPIKRMNIK